ncbi:TPA: hypothetical protein ACQSOV_004691 [Pseudomonas aeruginosa]|uniref:hypothetical protein n=1 Tax=Pseudomonas aeruginosa TaxID=287 RepID=UPI0010671A4A|nr:hypothetical protein [Pseudomonas aeruginosa]TEC26004.1 hypothetical protein IPC1599_01055 [Pseudomonas aeruginosa]HEJ4674301.1 hypothetical protein [Pseudomonas aeruginosa]
MSQQQAQLDALEHLLIGLLKSSDISVPREKIFELAESSVMGSDGPPGTSQKSAAHEYLAHLKQKL